MQNQQVLDIISNLKGRRNYEEKKSKKLESDSDSSSDYDPAKDDMGDMSTLEMQKFMQKMSRGSYHGGKRK